MKNQKIIFYLILINIYIFSQFTEIQKLAIPYTLVKNLYFDANKKTFFSLGNCDINQALANYDNRDYKVENRDTLNNIKPINFEDWSFIICDFEAVFITHFFHYLEHIVGFWGLFAHNKPNEIKKIIIAGPANPNKINGPNNLNKHITNAIFPSAQIIMLSTLAHNQILCFKNVVISDRVLTSAAIECIKINKHLGKAREYISKDSMNKLGISVTNYAKCKIEPKNRNINVTFIKRNPPRTLVNSLETKLLKEIAKNSKVKLASVSMEKLTFEQQINVIANTDILIGVHGNGLSHALFLHPKACVIELFPDNMHQMDYRLFCEIKGLEYYGIMGKHGIISHEFAYNNGSFGNPNQFVRNLDLNLVKNIVKNYVKKFSS